MPTLLGTLIVVVFTAWLNTRVMRARFDALNSRFDALNTRLDDMRDLWRAELRRVEEVLDARLKHLEEK